MMATSITTMLRPRPVQTRKASNGSSEVPPKARAEATAARTGRGREPSVIPSSSRAWAASASASVS